MPPCEESRLEWLNNRAFLQLLFTRSGNRLALVTDDADPGGPADDEDDVVRGTARMYSRAIGDAVGEFADLLTRAVTARRGRPSAKLREQMWAECLRFGACLARWRSASAWLNWVFWDWKRPAFSKAERREFLKLVEDRLCSWLEAADHRIELRLLLTRRRPGPRRGEGFPPSVDHFKLVVMHVTGKNPKLSTERISGLVDHFLNGKDIPIPENWTRFGATTMLEAYRDPKTQGSVKTYVSRIRAVVRTQRKRR